MDKRRDGQSDVGLETSERGNHVPCAINHVREYEHEQEQDHEHDI